METRQALHAIGVVPYIATPSYPRAVRTRVAPLDLGELGAGGSPELPGLGQVSFKRTEPEKEASGNWVAYIDGAQSREGLGDGVLLVSPTGQHHKYIIQLDFPGKGCARSTLECEGLLAGLRIAVGLEISCLSIHGDSQLMAGQAWGVKLSPPMKAYGERCGSLSATLGAPSVSDHGAPPPAEQQEGTVGPASERCILPAPTCRTS
jgi:hypothetical protein